MFHDDRARAKTLEHVGFVIDQEHREPKLALPLRDRAEQFAHQMAIESGERLVEQNQMWPAREHARQRDASRLSTRDRVRGGIPNRFEMQTFA